MTQQLLSRTSHSSSLKGQHHLLLLQGLGYLLPLSLFSGGVAIAQSSETPSVQPLPSLNQEESSSLEPIQASQNNEEQSQPPSLPDYESVPPLRIDNSKKPAQQIPPPSKPQPQAKPKPKLKPIQPLVNSSPANVPQVSSQEAPEPSPSTSPNSATESPQKPRKPSPQNSPTVETPTQEESTTATNDFIDLNGYPQAGENSLPAPKVEVSDRANNCTTVIDNGQLISGSCDLSQDNPDPSQPLVEIEKLPELPSNFAQPAPSQKPPIRQTYTPPENLPQLKLPGNGDSGLIFPLARSTAISSNYGWRIHPIYGNRRFHTGTDFTAPEGTPVVATKSGRVVLADYNSGYGLIVGLRHDNSNESRYAHLSQIHVRPGQWVEQGTVIGRVGNTGLSTGPHLHFEWRVRKGSRWIAVDARRELIAARDNTDPSKVTFTAMAQTEKHHREMKGGNFLAYLPEILASLPTPPASWMSIPELSFLKNGNFDQANYERQAPLAQFAQRSNSVLVLPFSLPKVLASIFNWQPPQLFTQENLERVPRGHQVSFQQDLATRPSPRQKEEDARAASTQASELLLLSPEENLESLTNLDALGTLKFASPRSETPQALSNKALQN